MSDGNCRNTINNVPLFLRRWETRGGLRARSQPVLRVSAHGNINSSGRGNDYRSPLLTPADELFWESIEPGVRALVAMTVLDFGWVTYTSCEGHSYAGTAAKPAERMVGLLPRSLGEQRTILAVTGAAAADCARMLPRPRVEKVPLNDSETGRAYEAIDIRFYRAGLSWEMYFERLDRICTAFVEALLRRRQAARP